MCIKAICTSTQTAKKAKKRSAYSVGLVRWRRYFWHRGRLPAVEGLGRSAFVLLPYLVEMGGLAAVGWALCRITAGGDPLRAYVYEATVLKIPRRAWVAMIGAAATLVGGIVYVASQGFCTDMAADLAFLLLHRRFLPVFLGRKEGRPHEMVKITQNGREVFFVFRAEMI